LAAEDDGLVKTALLCPGMKSSEFPSSRNPDHAFTIASKAERYRQWTGVPWGNLLQAAELIPNPNHRWFAARMILKAIARRQRSLL